MTDPLISSLQGKLIVSCQAYVGEPMRHPETMAQVALSAERGGAAAIRCQGLADIAAIKGQVEIPVIGLWKEGHDGVYITPTLRHARACIAAGSDVVAIDATARPRPDGRNFEETVKALRGETLIMADCSCMDDVQRALEAGADIVSTTLAGYVPGGREKTAAPTSSSCARPSPQRATCPCSARVASTRPTSCIRSWPPARGPRWWARRSRIRRPSRAGSRRSCERGGAHAQLHCSGRSESSPCRPAARRVRCGDCLVRLHRLSQS